MNTKTNPTFGLTVLAAALAFSAAGAAQSPNAPDAPSVTVRYADSDLSTTAGTKSLYRRIRNAAWTVCLETLPGGPNGIEKLQCRQTLVDAAVAEVNNPALTALHTGTKTKANAMTASR